MTVAGHYLEAICATVKRDVSVFLSYRFRFVTQIATMLLTMTMFYYISKIVRPGVVGPGGRYFAYVVVGIVSLAILTAAVNTAQLVRMELFAGTFERVVISPVGPVGGVIALAVFPILYAIVLAGLMLGAAAGIFGFPVHVAEMPQALAVALLAALAFAGIGLLFVAGTAGVQVRDGRRLGDRRAQPARRGLLSADAVPGLAPVVRRRAAVHPRRRPAPSPASRNRVGPAGLARAGQTGRVLRGPDAGRCDGARARGRAEPPARHADGVLTAVLGRKPVPPPLIDVQRRRACVPQIPGDFRPLSGVLGAAVEDLATWPAASARITTLMVVYALAFRNYSGRPMSLTAPVGYLKSKIKD